MVQSLVRSFVVVLHRLTVWELSGGVVLRFSCLYLQYESCQGEWSLGSPVCTCSMRVVRGVIHMFSCLYLQYESCPQVLLSVLAVSTESCQRRGSYCWARLWAWPLLLTSYYRFYEELEKKYAPTLDNYGQSCFVVLYKM
jgi:hypothetical protein